MLTVLTQILALRWLNPGHDPVLASTWPAAIHAILDIEK
jgi:hypothetical protein